MYTRRSLSLFLSRTDLSAAKSACGAAALASHAVGPAGELATLGQPASPSAGYGSAPWSPWWWQCGSENDAQKPSPSNGSDGGVAASLRFWPPVTTPELWTNDHGV